MIEDDRDLDQFQLLKMKKEDVAWIEDDRDLDQFQLYDCISVLFSFLFWPFGLAFW